MVFRQLKIKNIQVMRSYKEVVAESNDLEPITDRTEPVSDKTEPIESSVWDSVSEKDEVVSIGADVKTKAREYFRINYFEQKFSK